MIIVNSVDNQITTTKTRIIIVMKIDNYKTIFNNFNIIYKSCKEKNKKLKKICIITSLKLKIIKSNYNQHKIKTKKVHIDFKIIAEKYLSLEKD